MGKTNVSLRGKNVLGLADFSAEEIRLVLETAKEMKNIIHRDIKKVPTLRGKSIVTLFYEPSTRTRTSFELAGKYLGADVVNITAGTSSIVKGESLRDTLYTIEAMGVDAIVMRHKAEGAAEYAARVVSPVIINAGDGAHAHPSQGLLNLFTIEQHKGHLEGLKVAILGDVLHSRVARSDIYGMRKMGMEVHIAGPKTLPLGGAGHRRARAHRGRHQGRGRHRSPAHPARAHEGRSLPDDARVRPHLRPQQ